MRTFGRFLLWAVIGLALVVGMLRATSIRWWRVPDDDPYLEASLTPSLRAGDWVLLWRLTMPSSGSLTICPEPKHPERVVVGRVIGQDGDHVKVKGTHIEVNEKILPSEGACHLRSFTAAPPQGGTPVEQFCSTEVVNGAIHERGEADSSADKPIFEADISPGQLLLVSDNRRYPYDSRDYGLIDEQLCKETIFFRLIGPEGFFHAATRFTYIR